jgi:hypothetical protein
VHFQERGREYGKTREGRKQTNDQTKRDTITQKEMDEFRFEYAAANDETQQQGVKSDVSPASFSNELKLATEHTQILERRVEKQTKITRQEEN